MIRTITIFLSALMLVGCGGDDTNKSVSSPPPSLPALKTEISKLSSQFDNNKKQLDDVYKHIKNANKQLPKLHSVVQSQIMAQSKANKDSLKQVQQNSQKQFQQMQKDLNDFGEKLAKAGYE